MWPALDTPNRPNPEQAAELPHSRIPFPALSARRGSDRKPNLIASRNPIDALEQEFEIEAEFQFADDDNDRLISAQSDEIAATDFTFDLKAEFLQVALHRHVEGGLQQFLLCKLG